MENEKFQNLVLELLARLSQGMTEVKLEINEVKQVLNRINESLARIENDHPAKF